MVGQELITINLFSWEEVLKLSCRTYYIMKNARGVSTDIVVKHLKTLEEIDYKIKTGQIDKKIGLELFILGQ